MSVSLLHWPHSVPSSSQQFLHEYTGLFKCQELIKDIQLLKNFLLQEMLAIICCSCAPVNSRIWRNCGKVRCLFMPFIFRSVKNYTIFYAIITPVLSVYRQCYLYLLMQCLCVLIKFRLRSEFFFFNIVILRMDFQFDRMECWSA